MRWKALANDRGTINKAQTIRSLGVSSDGRTSRREVPAEATVSIVVLLRPIVITGAEKRRKTRNFPVSTEFRVFR